MTIDPRDMKLRTMLLDMLKRQPEKASSPTKPPSTATLRSLMEQVRANSAKIISEPGIVLVPDGAERTNCRLVVELRRQSFRVLKGGKASDGPQ